MNHEKRRILLTGASSGIGHAMALEYARQGARLLLVARRTELLEETAERVRALGGEAVALAIDVTEPGAAERAVALADEAFGGVDVVIMNAGFGLPTYARSFNVGEFERIMAVNYLSVVRMIGATLPKMLEEGRGHLVAVSSLAAYRGWPGSAAYNASKAAVTVLMESLRADLYGSGVTITTIAPGFVRTPMTDNNQLHMPFLLEADESARRIVRAIDARQTTYSFPLPLTIAAGVMRLIPSAIYDRFGSWGGRVVTKKS